MRQRSAGCSLRLAMRESIGGSVGIGVAIDVRLPVSRAADSYWIVPRRFASDNHRGPISWAKRGGKEEEAKSRAKRRRRNHREQCEFAIMRLQ